MAANFTIRIYWVLVLLLLTVTGCFQQDSPITLPPPGELTFTRAVLGADYGTEVYMDFSTGTQTTARLSEYDLLLEADADGYRVRLNTGKFMFAKPLDTQSWETAVTPDAINAMAGRWRADVPTLHPDSTAIGRWTPSTMYAIDRGRVFHRNDNDRYRRLLVQSVDAKGYTILFSTLSQSQPTIFYIPKDSNYTHVYFSFDDGGKVVKIAPKRNEWDAVFHQYMHIYNDQPEDSPTKYYLVRGMIQNRTMGVLGAAVISDFTRYPKFDSVTISHIRAGLYTFTPQADVIGFDWKDFDIQGNYYIRNDNYYVLQDRLGLFYKIKFTDFYDERGQRGTCVFAYRRL